MIQESNRALERCALPWTKPWGEPENLTEFLMPAVERREYQFGLWQAQRVMDLFQRISFDSFGRV
jgi:hypothetical protein